MADAEIPKQIQRFIAAHVDSVGQLEALLLLRSGSQPWRAAQVAERLYVSEAEAMEVLDRLCSSGLVVRSDEAYRYECRTEELRRMVDDLAQLYARQLIPITNLIHAKSRRIRGFADAFRFRKDR
jgi:Mn-dependent DtxR family transcriptional regulator